MSATFGAALNMTTPVLSSAATASVAGTHSHLPPLMPPASPIIGIQRSPNGNSNYNSGSSNYNNSRWVLMDENLDEFYQDYGVTEHFKQKGYSLYF